MVKEEPGSSPAHQLGCLLPPQRLKLEHDDATESSIKVLDVTSISLEEMEQLSRGHNRILENPLAIRRRRRLRRFQHRVAVPCIDDVKSEPAPRPSNAVATVLAEQQPDDDEANYGHENQQAYRKAPLAENGLEQQLLKPQKVEDVNIYTKRKRGRPRKIRHVMEIYPMAQVNGLTKRKRGRPRKYKLDLDESPKSPDIKDIQLAKKPDAQYFKEEILMTRLRNKRL